jgi:CRP/FNR family cyclic AMP-dependent transcriptional regulator
MTMVTEQVLASVPLFMELPMEQLAALARCATRRGYPRGSVILNAREPADGFNVILSGRAKALIPDDEGHEIILSILGPHDFFGEFGLLDGLPCSASVVSLAPCELIRIAKADFTSCLSESFELTMRVMRGLVKRLRAADRQIESLALMSVRERVARLLLDLATPVNGHQVVLVAPSKIQIARMIGASREMVSRTLKAMRAAGNIRVEKPCIILGGEPVAR